MAEPRTKSSTSNEGTPEAEGAVKGFIEGWVQSSGTTPGQFAAGQTRRFLGGDLASLAVCALAAPVARSRSRKSPTTSRSPLPPDLGFETVESTKHGETGAIVKVRLKCSVNKMIKAGKVQPEAAAKAFDAAKGQSVRTLTLVKGEGGWQITKVAG